MPNALGTFDIVYCVGPKDREIVKLSVQSVERFVSSYRRIYLISREPLHLANCIDISENEFPFQLPDINDVIGVPSRCGWYFQQLLKLYVKDVIPDLSSRYLIIDSDTVFLKDIQFFGVDPKGEERILFNCTDKENHGPYFEWMNRLHPDFHKRIRESGVVHHMMFDQIIVQSLREKVETYHQGKAFWRVFIEQVSPEHRAASGASEYELYFNYMLGYYPGLVGLRKLPFESVRQRLTEIPSHRSEAYINSHWWNREEDDFKYVQQEEDRAALRMKWKEGFSEEEIITGERLQQLCDVTCLTHEVDRFHTSLPSHVRRVFMDELLQGNVLDPERDRVIFVYTHLLDQFIKEIWPRIEHPVVVMTHNSDGVIDERYRSWIEDTKLLHLYSQNLLLVHPKATALPIGLANSMWPHGDTKSISALSKKANEGSRKERVALNFRVGTYIQHRCNVMRDLHRSGTDYVCDCISTNLLVQDCYREIQGYRYCACPRGNGPDTHRLWESLYLGCIPLVDEESGARQFKDLPMINISNWKDISRERLDAEYANLARKGSFHWDTLCMSWWKTQINSYKTKETINGSKVQGSFVLSYQGILPDYLEICIRQIRYWSPRNDIYIAYDAHPGNMGKINKWSCISGVKWIKISSLRRTEWHQTFDCQYMNRSMNGFWKYATERFFVVEEVMRQYDLQDVFHLEADNMIYFNYAVELPRFQGASSNADGTSAMLAPSDNDTRYIAGVCYIPTVENLCKMNQFFAERSRHQAEMEQMMVFSQLYPNSLRSLPVLPTDYQGNFTPLEGNPVKEPHRFSRYTLVFGGVFDAAALGQYLGGIDKIHNPGNTDGFINPHSAYRISEMKVKYSDGGSLTGSSTCPWISTSSSGEEWYRVYNLHIHSKELSRFQSF